MALERGYSSVLVTRNDIAVARLVSAGPLKARIAHGEDKTRTWLDITVIWSARAYRPSSL